MSDVSKTNEDLLGFIDQTLYANEDGGWFWTNAEVIELLNEIRALATRVPVQGEREVTGNTSDGYHTFDELYEYRMLYNAHASHGWLAAGIPVVKSWKHSDGELCFGGGWFIVTATLPAGQVSNHYKAEHWGLFKVPEVELPPAYDGHTPKAAADRLRIEAEHARAVRGEPNDDRESLITERTYGHGSITLTHYRSSGRIGVVQRGENSVMDVTDLLVFLQDSGLDEDFSRAAVPDAATEPLPVEGESK